MMVWNFIIWLIASVSLSNIMTQEFVFQPYRDWVEKTFPYNKKLIYLVNCPVCTGFWTGIATSFLFSGVEWWWAGFISSIACKMFIIWCEKD